MRILLHLYPRRWQRRYGAEVEDLLARQPFSLAAAIDLVAGAIDVRLHPGVTMAAASARPEGAPAMSTRAFGLDCSAAGRIPPADQWRASKTTIAATIVLTLVWMVIRISIGDNAYVEAFSIFPFMVALVLSMRVTYLKARPFSVYAVFVIGWSVVFGALLLGAAWLAATL